MIHFGTCHVSCRICMLVLCRVICQQKKKVINLFSNKKNWFTCKHNNDSVTFKCINQLVINSNSCLWLYDVHVVFTCFVTPI